MTFLSIVTSTKGRQRSHEVTNGPNTYNTHKFQCAIYYRTKDIVPWGVGFKFDKQGMLVGIFLLFDSFNHHRYIFFHV